MEDEFPDGPLQSYASIRTWTPTEANNRTNTRIIKNN